MNKTGFGFLRLPRLNEHDETSIDDTLLNQMVDTFLSHGGIYFDTAYTYLNGASEAAIRESVIKRYSRDRVRIADKLPTWLVPSYEACQSYFDEQRARCGVDYFDVYLLHGLDAENYEHCQKEDFFKFLREKKREGTVRKIGFSFHDSPKLLERILTEHPEVDYVQLQINYLDWESEALQAKRCYEIAVQYGKKIIVMEPVKGGSLANVPDDVNTLLQKERPQDSPALWAIRFASSLEAVEIVLSGMNAMEQLQENMQDLDPVTADEQIVLEKAADRIREQTAVPCTGCGYCTADCPRNILIPKYFALYNEYMRDPKEGWKIQYRYDELAEEYGKPTDCIGCKRCERLCPQKIAVTDCLHKVKVAFHILEGVTDN